MATDKKSKESTKVTRIKATGSTAKKKKVNTTSQKNKQQVIKAKPAKKISTKKANRTKKKSLFSPIKTYLIGAWQELKLVQWPNRQATWGLTIAVIAFTLFFALIILLIDMVFQLLFNIILKG